MSAKTSDSPESGGELRARDIDRVHTRARLDAAYEEGQLGVEEYQQRSARAASAETVGQLRRLVRDLQPSKGTADFDLPKGDRGRAHRGLGYPGKVRARDSDRAATCVVLDAAHADGQLTVEDHRALVELAQNARTLGELAELTADLQRGADAPGQARPPRSMRRQWFGIGVVAAAVAAAAGMFVVVDRPASRPPVVEIGAVQPLVIPTPNLTTAEGVTHFLAVYRAKFGDLFVDELTLHEEHASVQRSVPGQANRKVSYTYRGGFEQGMEIETRKTDTPVFDLGAIDSAALGTLLASAPASLNVAGGTISHLSFETNDHLGHRAEAAPTISIYVRNSFGESGYLKVTPAGAVVYSSPFKG